MASSLDDVTDKTGKGLGRLGRVYSGRVQVSCFQSSLKCLNIRIDLGQSSRQWVDASVENGPNADNVSIWVSLRGIGNAPAENGPNADNVSILGQSSRQWVDASAENWPNVDNVSIWISLRSNGLTH